MNVLVLGSAGSEAPGNNAPAFLVDDFLLLDAGTIAPSLDTNAQCRITHIFITHAHLDHIKGIPFLVDNLVSIGRHCHIQLLSGKKVLADLRKNIFNNRIWPDFTTIPSPQQPVMAYADLAEGKPVEVGKYRIQAVKVQHSVPAFGYLIEEPSRGTLVYTGDTGPTEAIWHRMKKHRVKALIIEVSFPNDMEELAIATGHLTPALLDLEIRKMATIPEKIYISHLKAFYKEKIQEELARLSGVDLELLEEGKRFQI